MAYNFKADLQSKVNKTPPPLRDNGKKPTENKPTPPVREIGYQPRANKSGRTR